ncbi:MAG: hypothetical protein ABFC28_09940 [Rikenellaceae bacterium]
MKKFGIFMAVMAALFFISPTISSAQFGVKININLQPKWGPADYDYVEYYYMPEYDIYYYAPERQFIYRNGREWVFSRNLPYQYRNVDLYSTYKVVINEPKPYLRHNYYSSHYKEYKHARSKQEIIRDAKRPTKYVSTYRHDNSRNGDVVNSRDKKESHDNNNNDKNGNKKKDDKNNYKRK